MHSLKTKLDLDPHSNYWSILSYSAKKKNLKIYVRDFMIQLEIDWGSKGEIIRSP